MAPEKQPYAAASIGLFAPALPADDEREAVERWVSEQHTLFLSLIKIHNEAIQERRRILQKQGSGGARGWKREDSPMLDDLDDVGPPASHLPYYTRLFSLIIQSVRGLIQELADSQDASSSTYLPHLTRTLLPVLTLAQTLYVSPNATDLQHAGEGIIGEELLHWLNSYDLAPTTEQGQEIASSSEPFLHPSYWDYILRCTLRGFHSTVSTMMATLMQLPSGSLQTLVSRVRDLIKNLPRSTTFKTEVQFKTARRDFNLKLNGVLAGLEGVMDAVQDELAEFYASEREDDEAADEEAEDLRLSLEAGLRVFLEVLAGNRERVVEAAEDWKEALAAWATLVDVGLKRDGLAAALDRIRDLREGPAFLSEERTGKAEQLMIQLIRGEVKEASEYTAGLDPYLAQILIDFFHKLGLLSIEEPVASTSNLVEGANLVYANTILATFGFWRMALDYMAQGGLRGRARMTQVLLGLPLLEDPSQAASKQKSKTAEVSIEEDDEASAQAGQQPDEFHMIESVLEACSTFGLVREAKAIGRKISLHLSSIEESPEGSSSGSASLPRFGPAVAYALRSEPPRGDLTMLKTIKRRVLSGLLSQRRKSSESQWLIDHVTDMKRWIIRAFRSEATAQAEAAGLATAEGPFIPRKRTLLNSVEDDELIIADEEEWTHHFGSILPAPLLLLTNLAYYFQLRKQKNDTAAASLLVEVLNAGLVDGDWTAIFLYEIGQCLSPDEINPTSPGNDTFLAPLQTPPVHLSPLLISDILRLTESTLFNASLSPEEETFYLCNLGRWAAAAVGVGETAAAAAAAAAVAKGEAEGKGQDIKRAKREMSKLRYTLALALSISTAQPPLVGGGDTRIFDPQEGTSLSGRIGSSMLPAGGGGGGQGLNGYEEGSVEEGEKLGEVGPVPVAVAMAMDG